MLIVAGVAAARKISDERAKKKEAKQGLLSIGDSDLAKRAFANQSQRTIKDGSASIQSSGTDIRYEDPDSLDGSSPTVSAQGDGYLSPTSPTPSGDVKSPVTSNGRDRSVSQVSNAPPPYSPQREKSLPERPYSSNVQKHDRSADAASFDSSDSVAIKIRTKGPDLKSGFAYHPALFDLNVRPDLWDQFTYQIVETTKSSPIDKKFSSVFGGKNKMEVEKVKASLRDTDAGLGGTLQRWNETYFEERGLHVQLELSDSTKKREEGRGVGMVTMPVELYSGRETRDKKREDRKYVIVVTKVEPEHPPSTSPSAVEGVSEMAAEGPGAMAELPATEDAKYDVVELPGNDEAPPVELPAMDYDLPAAYSLGYGSDKLEPPSGLVELDSDTTHLLKGIHLSDDKKERTSEGPLMVTASVHQAFNKEVT